jgi:hypothetical protein
VGRSATSATAYRLGEKLHSVAHASYQSDKKLQNKSGKITHDYRKRRHCTQQNIIARQRTEESTIDKHFGTL